MAALSMPYYYGYEAEQFSFYRIPKRLFKDDRFRDVSTGAKLLYGLLLDRMALSLKNGWLDEQGRVFIYCTAVSWADALPGDLVFYPDDTHVGIVAGWDENGNILIVHCASGYNNVVITGK